MTRILAALAALAFAAPAIAQQQRPATQAELSGVAEALSAQVETFRNMHIQAAAKAGALADENAKLKLQIEELQKRAEVAK